MRSGASLGDMFAIQGCRDYLPALEATFYWLRLSSQITLGRLLLTAQCLPKIFTTIPYKG